MDDLTVLEKVNLLMIGLASFNCHMSVPSDVPSHNQVIPAENLKSQEYIQKIQEWTIKQKMILNQKKTKAMIFNFTSTSSVLGCSWTMRILKLWNSKLLGVIISDDLNWDENTSYLVRKANARMELLRKVAKFNTSVEEKKEYICALHKEHFGTV